MVKYVRLNEEFRGLQFSKRRWIPVPAGGVNDGQPSDGLLFDNVRCWYQQKDYITCVFKSMASVFHYCKRQTTASYLSSIAHAGGTQDLDARSQLDKLMKEVQIHEKVYHKIDFLSSPKAISKVRDLQAGSVSTTLDPTR